ncbi:MAG: sulfite exporter TauE/SafE family protein [bacterium]|nr:sulfite exporter TauE/SafE family protein [bacterium]
MELEIGTSLLMAIALGSLHVLEPVHGRSIFYAILVGSSRSVWRVIRFGVAVTLSHILTALLIALFAYLIGERIGAEQLTRGGQIIGITLSFVIGLVMLRSAIRSHREHIDPECHCVCHTIEEDDEKDKPEHQHKHPPKSTHQHNHKHFDVNSSVTLLGISGGIIPCSASVATLILAISTGKLAAGLQAMVAFGLGLGVTLTVVGIITVYSTGKLTFFDSPKVAGFVRFAPSILVLVVSVLSLIFLYFSQHDHHIIIS